MREASSVSNIDIIATPIEVAKITFKVAEVRGTWGMPVKTGKEPRPPEKVEAAAVSANDLI
jgi:hypothetical protein